MDDKFDRRSVLAKLALTPAAAMLVGHSIPHVGAQTPVAPLEIEQDRTALLILDFQPRWLDTIPDAMIAIDKAAAALQSGRALGMLVAFARVAFTPADDAAVPEGNIIFDALSHPAGSLDDGAPDLEITPELTPLPTEKAVRKTRVSAFARTDLDSWLRAMSVDTLLLAGISSSGVILSTVCDGADLDYRLVVLQDACADRDPVIQETLMQRIFPQRAEVASVAQVFDPLS